MKLNNKLIIILIFIIMISLFIKQNYLKSLFSSINHMNINNNISLAVYYVTASNI
jgi:hypothetical protein